MGWGTAERRGEAHVVDFIIVCVDDNGEEEARPDKAEDEEGESVEEGGEHGVGAVESLVVDVAGGEAQHGHQALEHRLEALVADVEAEEEALREAEEHNCAHEQKRHDLHHRRLSFVSIRSLSIRLCFGARQHAAIVGVLVRKGCARSGSAWRTRVWGWG